ncbi:MAG: GNAT family N-acetyltransferase [Chloroflexi bacterium]|nr:GNAT family N-acetyltransferase [Chloroflexota bacterium]
MTPQLVAPDVAFQQSYLEALLEFHAENRNLEQDETVIEHDFAGYVRYLHMQSTDERREGLVPESFYWLVDDDLYIGRVSVRHSLNNRLLLFGGHIGYEIRTSQRRKGYGTLILQLGLAKARSVGITRALVTCDDDNIGSAKVIEANGGILENTVLLNHRPVATRRYWIDVTG